MQMETEKQIETEEMFDENHKDCDCSHGYIYSYDGEICKQLGGCHCYVRSGIEAGGRMWRRWGN